MDFSFAAGLCWHGRARPRHAGGQDPQDEVEDPMIAECAPGTTLGQGAANSDTLCEGHVHFLYFLAAAQRMDQHCGGGAPSVLIELSIVYKDL